MSRRVGLPTALLVALALTLPSAALAISLFIEGEGSGLTIEVQPPGSGVVTGPFFYCEDTCSYEGEVPATFTAEAKPGYAFKGWGHCPAPSGHLCTVTGGSSGPIAAKFVRTASLTLSKPGESSSSKVTSSPAGVSCLAGCTATRAVFLHDTDVKLKPAPAKHFHFVEWLGDCTGSGLCEVPMDEDREVEARFAEDPKLPLTLTKVGVGEGLVRSRPAGVVCGYHCTVVEASFYEGEAVVLEVSKVGKGSTFEGWSGCDSEPEGKCRVTMDAAKSVTATFG